MTNRKVERRDFRVVENAAAGEPLRRFCGHCGRPPSPEGGAEQSRVCQSCGLGLLLEAPASLAPAPEDPFLVIDSSLAVCALSRRAERLLGLSETEAVNRHVNDLLVSADVEAGDEAFAAALVNAARGEGMAQNLIVRPTNAFGVRYWARIGLCGPQRAALMVLAVV
jgi:hypothetical protein